MKLKDKNIHWDDHELPISHGVNMASLIFDIVEFDTEEEQFAFFHWLEAIENTLSIEERYIKHPLIALMLIRIGKLEFDIKGHTYRKHGLWHRIKEKIHVIFCTHIYTTRRKPKVINKVDKVDEAFKQASNEVIIR